MKEEYLIAVGVSDELAKLWLDSVTAAAMKYGIDNFKRVCAFLAQCAHESSGFERTIENLNYSAGSLRKTFGRYFPTDELANQYARRPDSIANHVYASRMGNGPEESGDGWKFRGRGLIQLTGKNNVRAFSTAHFGDERLVEKPDSLSDRELASMSAAWFWKSNGLNELADTDDFEAITKKINGGLNGYDDRVWRWESIKKLKINPSDIVSVS